MKQERVKRHKRPRPTAETPPEAPTLNVKIAKLWFGEEK